MTKSTKKDSKLAVVEEPVANAVAEMLGETTVAPPVEIAAAAGAGMSQEPQFLGDWSIQDDEKAGVAKIAWNSEEGIRRAEIPHWLFEKIREAGR